MTVIDPSSRLGVFLRLQTPEVERPSNASARLTDASPQLQQGSPKTNIASTFMDSLSLLEPAIRQQLLQRVRALSREDARQTRKVFQLFLESVLAQEFFANSKPDVDWERLAGPVIDQMESDQELASAIKEAASYLIKAAAAPNS